MYTSNWTGCIFRFVLLLATPFNVRVWISPLSEGLHTWGGCVPIA